MLFFSLLIAAVASSSVQAKKGSDHPTLPEMWKSETIDPPMPKGIEEYNFVATPTEDNPSAMWSKYPGCKRLIYVPGYSGKRYLMGCGFNDCCWESQTSNQVEFQIPNVHYTDPNKEVEVSYQRVNITNFGEVVEADEWSWSFTSEKFYAYTEDCDDCYLGVRLLQWQAQVGVMPPAKIQFKGYAGIDPNSQEGKDFDATFAVPDICQANNLLECPDDLHDKFFGPNAKKQPVNEKPHYRVYGSTCTGPHEFCCEAPNADPKNCPASAYTSDCAKQNACCCG
jgi:hypothetical protein